MFRDAIEDRRVPFGIPLGRFKDLRSRIGVLRSALGDLRSHIGVLRGAFGDLRSRIDIPWVQSIICANGTAGAARVCGVDPN